MAENKVYLLLTDTGSFFTKLIKLYTKKPYNHASISFQSNVAEAYSFGRKKMNNPFVGGFVKENLKTCFFQQAEAVVCSLTVTDIQLHQMKQYIQEIEKEKEHYRYNFLGLLGFLFGTPIPREKALFCSQFVATVLQQAEILDLERQPALMTPYHLLEIAEWEWLYQGRLKDYNNHGTIDKWCIPNMDLPMEWG
ncbi:hypothetical protein [Gracilibacillus timonensis]|uniref:hypothetical protein n=1 Tax=Gracilibacillus timonensis TaxID=1816696 RepID=UPI000826C388|nr:hypothetical protein [Gracilibacillus timonensis]